MKLWQKAVLMVLAVFAISLVLVLTVSIQKTTRLNREFAQTAAVGEHALIERSVVDRLDQVAHLYTHFNANNLPFYLEPYGNYYRSQQVYFDFLLDGALVFSSLPRAGQAADAAEYAAVSARLPEPYAQMELVYYRDVTDIVRQQAALVRFSLMTGTAVMLALAALMILLMKKLTRPLTLLNRMATEIAGGAYHRRVAVASNDEIGAFAHTFNAMADAVALHVEQLEAVTEARQRFIDNLSHEMRTPITAIVGYADYLKLAVTSEDDRLRALEHIGAQSRRIQVLAQKLLALSRLQHEAVPARTPVSLRQTAEAALRTLAQPIAKKRLQISVAGEGTVPGDADLLESLVLNLLENALRASAEGESIQVDIQGEGLTIADYGVGIPPEALPKIIEPFYRVDASRSRAYGGAGLGLSLCQSICDLHGAAMTIASVPGEGTTVTVKFAKMLQNDEEPVR